MGSDRRYFHCNFVFCVDDCTKLVSVCGCCCHIMYYNDINWTFKLSLWWTDVAEVIETRATDATPGQVEYYVHYTGCKL